MKVATVRSTVLLLVLGGVVLGGWWVFAQKNPGLPSPKQFFAPAPVPVNETINVTAGQRMAWTFTAPDGMTPGLFEGRWQCSGISSNIPGASDDTLVGFELRGPDNAVMQQLDHPFSGNFSVQFSAPGKCTLIFDNSGIIRSSARKVIIEGTFHRQ